MSAHIKRGTTRRLGLTLPQHVLTMRIQPDLSEWFRAFGVSVEDFQVPQVDWSDLSTRPGKWIS